MAIRKLSIVIVSAWSSTVMVIQSPWKDAQTMVQSPASAASAVARMAFGLIAIGPGL